MPIKNLGLAYILLSVFFASLMVILIKYLSDYMNIYSILFYRGFFGFILVLPFFLKLNPNILITKRIHIHFIRSIVNALALYFWFTPLTLSSLADVSAIGNSAPIFATLLAILFMKEKIFFSRITAIVFGFVGVIIILNPHFDYIELGHYYALTAAVLWGFLVVFLKNLSRTENSFSVIFYFQLFLFVSFGIFFYDFIEVADKLNFVLILLLALFGNLSQICYFQALKLKDITFISPFEYLRFIFLTVFGIIFFYEYPNLRTYIGSFVIFLGILILNFKFNFLKKEIK